MITHITDRDRKIKILFLAATSGDASSNTARMRLEQEVREIQERLQLAKQRDRFALEKRMSVRPIDITQAILDTKPDVIHFSGYGTQGGELHFESRNGTIHAISPIETKHFSTLFKESEALLTVNSPIDPQLT